MLELIHAAYPSRGRGPIDASVPAHIVDGQPLSRGAIRASIQLYQRGAVSMGELAGALGMSNGWASRVVDELVRAGLVARSSDPLDRRIVHVALTPAATDFVASAYRWRGEAIERALGGIDPDGRAAIHRFLARAIEELQPASEARPPHVRGEASR